MKLSSDKITGLLLILLVIFLIIGMLTAMAGIEYLGAIIIICIISGIIGSLLAYILNNGIDLILKK